jgi:hypothetical protein
MEIKLKLNCVCRMKDGGVYFKDDDLSNRYWETLWKQF